MNLCKFGIHFTCQLCGARTKATAQVNAGRSCKPISSALRQNATVSQKIRAAERVARTLHYNPPTTRRSQ